MPVVPPLHHSHMHFVERVQLVLQGCHLSNFIPDCRMSDNEDHEEIDSAEEEEDDYSVNDDSSLIGRPPRCTFGIRHSRSEHFVLLTLLFSFVSGQLAL